MGEIKTMNYSDMAIEILHTTHDGDDLAPEHLKLLEMAVNGHINELGEVAFMELYANVKSGYVRPWLHDIEHLTIDHEGFVYWKGHRIEHYNIPWAYGEEAKECALDVAQRCQILDERGITPTTATIEWTWEDNN